jgi:hypothetical protein
MRTARGALIAYSLLVATSAARADAPGPNAPPIQVIAVRSDDAEDQADALTAALRNRVRALRGFSLGDGDYALEVLTLGLKCGESPDEACQIKIGNQIRADRFVWGSVKRSKSAKQVVADLHLWTRGRPSTKTEFTFSDNLTAPGDDGLRRLVDEALNVLLERQKAPVAAGAAVRLGAPRLRSRSPGTERNHAAVTRPARTGLRMHRRARNIGLELAQHLGWTGIGVGRARIAAGVFSAIKVSSIANDETVERYRQVSDPRSTPAEQAEAGIRQGSGRASPSECRISAAQRAPFRRWSSFSSGSARSPRGPDLSWRPTLRLRRRSGSILHRRLSWTIERPRRIRVSLLAVTDMNSPRADRRCGHVAP